MAPRYNGHHFRALVNASLEGIRQVETEINRLNVFPVPDSDTGTNLRMTLEAVAQAVNDGDLSASAYEIAERAARAALMAARGNSGVMLAQLFRSISRTLRGREMFSGEEFSIALQQASDMLYRAVGDPVEGTILTVLRRAAEAAQEGAERLGVPRPRLLGVTVLTSLGDEDLDRVGQRAPAADQVRRLAALAQACGLDGVVASPQEAAMLRAECGPGFLLVIPGLRPAWAPADDQKRVMTPAQAVAAGADYLVIGRPITRADDPAAAAARIAAEIGA